VDNALPQLQRLILSAVPEYEAYLEQVLGRPFPLKLPVMKPNPDNLRFTFESVNLNTGGYKEPERVVMKVEYLRSMKMATLRVEYWPDIHADEPKAVNEPNIADSVEHLTSPVFVFGWLKKMAGGWAESVEPEDMVEARMVYAESLIVKADEVLAEFGFVIEANDYESYANTLDSFLLNNRLDEQTEGILSKVGDVVRGAAKAYGAAKGAVQGAKTRWSDFKASVKGAFQVGHKKGFDATSGRAVVKKKLGPRAKKGAEAPAKHEPIVLKGNRSPKKGAEPKKGERHPGGKMKDSEYKSRYGRARAALAAALEPDERAAMLERATDDIFEDEMDSLDVPDLLALEAMVELLAAGELEEGTKFKALVGKLKARGGVRNPAALAAWIGRKKYGAEKFAKMAAAGRSEGSGEPSVIVPIRPLAATSPTALRSFNRLSGVSSGTEGWKLP
jgi:hypothetical protein